MKLVFRPWLAWLTLGVVIGVAGAELLPKVEPEEMLAKLPAQELVVQQPTPEPPTPTPEPYIPCKDDPSIVSSPPAGPEGEPANYLHTCYGLIYDSKGRQVQITGVSWFGMEAGGYAPGGLAFRNWKSILDQVAAMGFNTIRLPFTNEAFRPYAQPKGINYELNSELLGLTPLEIMDRVVAGARERGLKVILDRHRPESKGQSSFWYTPAVSEEQWTADWRMVARRYRGNDTVIGLDLHNEPWGQAAWGTGDPATDWRLAVEKAGNAVLEENPYLLVLVEGIEHYDGAYWWGGNLTGVRDSQVNLKIPNRVVYSPHDFGPGVYPQAWFSDPTFPTNMESIWDMRWGFIKKQGVAPIVVGEFGGRSVGVDTEGTYQRTIMEYMERNDMGYLYWALNPDSPDSGGLLTDDWAAPLIDKLGLLSRYQAPLMGKVMMRTPPGSPTAQAASN